MRHAIHKHFFYAIVLFVVVTIAGLWSWNTLSELFDLPQAQYKHALAAFFALLILKWRLSSNRCAINRVFGGHHENPNH